MSPIPIGVRAAAGLVTPRISASCSTSSRESETETMAILLWQAIRDGNELAGHLSTRDSEGATRVGGP